MYVLLNRTKTGPRSSAACNNCLAHGSPLWRKKSVPCTLHTRLNDPVIYLHTCAFMANDEFLQKKEMDTQKWSQNTLFASVFEIFLGEVPGTPLPPSVVKGYSLTHPHRRTTPGSITDNCNVYFNAILLKIQLSFISPFGPSGIENPPPPPGGLRDPPLTTGFWYKRGRRRRYFPPNRKSYPKKVRIYRKSNDGMCTHLLFIWAKYYFYLTLDLKYSIICLCKHSYLSINCTKHIIFPNSYVIRMSNPCRALSYT